MTTNQRAGSDRAAPTAPAPGAPGGEGAHRMAALRFPADKDYLALARTTAMHVAGLLGLPLSRVTDLRLAVDEACAAFLTAGRAVAQAATGGAGAGGVGTGAVVAGAGGTGAASANGGRSQGSLDLRYDLYPGRLCISVRAPVPASWPEVDEIGWTLLQALVSEVRTEVDGGVGTLILVEELPAEPPTAQPALPPPAV